MPSRDLNDLCPEMQTLAAQFKAACLEAGVATLIYCTYRSNTEQDAEYAKGRTSPGSIVTHAKGGESPHNCTTGTGDPAARAFDACPLDQRGQPVWDASNAAYAMMGQVWEGLGGVWGGHFENLRDCPHFEMANWKG